MYFLCYQEKSAGDCVRVVFEGPGGKGTGEKGKPTCKYKIKFNVRKTIMQVLVKALRDTGSHSLLAIQGTLHENGKGLRRTLPVIETVMVCKVQHRECSQ